MSSICPTRRSQTKTPKRSAITEGRLFDNKPIFGVVWLFKVLKISNNIGWARIAGLTVKNPQRQKFSLR
jgi:hypothetical protein